MTPSDALAWLDVITGRGWRLTLDRVEEVLRRLGDPQDAFAAVHVTGTNGKGSVAAFTEAALLEAGLTAGRFTSPHVIRLEERVRVGGRDAEPEALAGWLTAVRDAAGEDQGITYFEAMTAAAWLAFREHDVGWAAVEVGLGGRLDATRTCRPAVSVITTVSLDHTSILGDTHAAIAREKVAIARAGVPLVTGATGEALDAVLTGAAAAGAPVRVLGRDFHVRPAPDGSWCYEGPTWRIDGWRPVLPGEHQGHNGACAIAALEALAETGAPVTAEHARAGLGRAQLRGRLEYVTRPPGTPALLVDCAHNGQGAQALRRYLDDHHAHQRIHMVFGSLADGRAEAALGALAGRVAHVTVTTVEAGTRTRTAADLLPIAQRVLGDAEGVEDPVGAVHRAVRRAAPEDLVLVAGSLYLAGTILTAADEGAFWPAPHPHATLPM